MHNHLQAKMKGKGTLSTDPAPQYRTDIELSYANTRKGKVENKYNLNQSEGLNSIFGKDKITELYPVKVIQQFFQIVSYRCRKPTAPFKNRHALKVKVVLRVVCLEDEQMGKLKKLVFYCVLFVYMQEIPFDRKQTVIDRH